MIQAIRHIARCDRRRDWFGIWCITKCLAGGVIFFCFVPLMRGEAFAIFTIFVILALFRESFLQVSKKFNQIFCSFLLSFLHFNFCQVFFPKMNVFLDNS